MGRSKASFWRLAARVFLVPVFAWLLAAQSVLLPLAKAQAAERAGVDGALAIVCSPTLPMPGDGGEGAPAKQVHDLGCCTLASRMDLDLPTAQLAASPLLITPERVAQPVAYTLPESRAPPVIATPPAGARAPPSSL